MAGKGGARPGAGRPKGAVNKLAAEAVQKAKASGELPHEFLLRIVRGETIDGHSPDFSERMSAAIAAAPYFAPKLAAIEQKIEGEIVGVISPEPIDLDEWDEEFSTKSSVGTAAGTTGRTN